MNLDVDVVVIGAGTAGLSAFLAWALALPFCHPSVEEMLQAAFKNAAHALKEPGQIGLLSAFS